jgi:PAS domain S-box/PAS domain S-box/PAS domain S-box
MNIKKDAPENMKEILIVEDSPTQAEQLKHLLEQNGHKVLEAASGKQALALLDKHTPALVISDIVMPEMDGYELCRQIKSVKSKDDIPVILLTSLSSAEDVLDGLECGADNFITKPYSEEYLLSHVEQIIASRKLFKNERVRVGIEIMFGGKRRFVTADQQQMLSLLISTYEEAVRKNAELVKTQNMFKALNERLEDKVEERTAELRQSEASYRILFEQAADIILQLEITAEDMPVIREANGAALRLLGYERDELIGKPVTFINVAPDDYKIIVERRQNVLSGIGTLFEAKHRCKDGTVRDFECSAAEMQVGPKTFAITVERDVTERKQMEETFRESEQKYRNLVDGASEAILVAQDGMLKFVNHKTAKLTGRSELELMAKPFPEFIYPDDRKMVVDNYVKRIKGEPIPSIYEFRLLTVGGTAKWVEINADMIDWKGKPATLNFLTDITERKKEEENLRRLATVVLDSNDAITISDFEGRITAWNHGAEMMYGYTEKEALQKSIRHLTPPDREEEQKDFTRRLMAGEKITSLETLRVTKDGRILNIWMTVTKLVDDTGKPIGIASTERDITERKRLEKEAIGLQAQLLQAQKMEAVGTLAGGVAHDFNNLLTAISGYISLAMMKIDESDPVHRDLKQAGIAAGRAGNVVRQLLLFSRKQPAVELFSLNFNDTVNNLIKMLKRLIGEDVAIETELAPDLWTIKGDEGNIEQVIMNLVVNARDAMPHGGAITIRTQNAHIDEEYCKTRKDARPGAFACMSITDTGTGMDSGTMEHIFEPFFTTKEVGKGTGLGLSVVFGIVKQHEGWIVVESRPGGGTTFKIYLPSSYVKIVRKTTEKIRMDEYKGKGERILLVEDQDEVRGLAIDVLKGNGYAVFPAENAQKARELFAQEKGGFDLVFSDVVLPDVSGIRLFEELNTGRDLRVLFSSGYSDDKAGLGIIKEKNYRFLQKPYSVQALLVAIREVLDSKQRRTK